LFVYIDTVLFFLFSLILSLPAPSLVSVSAVLLAGYVNTFTGTSCPWHVFVPKTPTFRNIYLGIATIGLEGQTGDNVSRLVLGVEKKLGIPPRKNCGVCADGASNMQSTLVGAATRIADLSGGAVQGLYMYMREHLIVCYV
jgi:hypothetical protein